jgi:hypothetical protein
MLHALLLAQAQQNRNSSLTRFLTVRTEAFKLNGGCFSSPVSQVRSTSLLSGKQNLVPFIAASRLEPLKAFSLL